MKSITTKWMAALLVCAALAAAAVLAGCGTTPKAPKQKTEALDWKGAALGAPIPQWVMSSMESDVHVQSLDEFKDHYCFVVSLEDPNKEMAVAWVKNASNGAAEVARMVSTTVNDAATAQEAIKSGDEAVKRRAEGFRDSISNNNFRGLRQVGDFWVLARNRATKNEYYAGYALYIIPEQDLNDQIGALWQNFIDNNNAMSEAEREIYVDLINNIRSRLIGK